MEWLHVTAEQGLWGIFLASFLAATVLPGGSELLLFGYLGLHPEQFWPVLGLATLGNSLGGMCTYASSRFLPRWQRMESLPQKERLERWGSSALIFAWLPLIGDALCLAAGWLRLHWLPCLLYMALGKALRYALVGQGAML
ncbi:MAG: YqaA family protein [Azovibrio sp.]|uniref:YqaA family protein n=1 Tax=Azovibrio sp. TaxID=1872673 RepID=UPI003C709A52